MEVIRRQAEKAPQRYQEIYSYLKGVWDEREKKA